MNTAVFSPPLNEAQAACFLGISVSSLRKSRMNGQRTGHLPPPPHIKLGRRVVYLRDDLYAYQAQHRLGMPTGSTQ